MLPPVAARSWGGVERRSPSQVVGGGAPTTPRLLPAPQDREEVHFGARKIPRVEPGNLPGPRPVPCRGSSRLGEPQGLGIKLIWCSGGRPQVSATILTNLCVTDGSRSVNYQRDVALGVFP